MKRLAITIICFLLCCSISYAQDKEVFVPMPVTIFEDNFQSDSIGAFPSHWRISHRDSARYKRFYKVRSVAGRKTLLIKDWPIDHVVFGQPEPKMPHADYLPDSFTLEYDFRIGAHNSMNLELYATNAASVLFITVSRSNMRYVDYSGEDVTNGDKALSSFKINEWHHFALLYNEHQAICYIDGKKIITIPAVQRDPLKFFFSQSASGTVSAPSDSIAYSNFRLATGASAETDFNSLLNKNSFTTHAIVFDVNKADIKAGSIGYIKQLAEWLNQNPAIKLEIDGHTDNDGDAAANMKLSQDRANEVKKQLVLLGVNATRLTTKGFGATKPLQSNNTPEGKAENRRVEFIRK